LALSFYLEPQRSKCNTKQQIATNVTSQEKLLVIPFHFNFDTSRQQAGRGQGERIKDQSFVSDISLNGISTQLINEVCANLICKAGFDNSQIQNLIEDFSEGCEILPVSLETL
jgi:hypothetical protein